jgi:uncharacterized protein
MSEQPLDGPPPVTESGPPETVPPQPPGGPPPQSHPFWSYSDVLLFVGLLFASGIVSYGLVQLVVSVFRISVQSKVLESLVMQSLLYVLAFSALALLFRAQYDRPFWSSMGWTAFRSPPVVIIVYGLLTAFGVAFISVLIRTPATSNRITEMLQDRRAVSLVAVFGLTLGPLAEELIFRGFLQPLFVRSLGAALGIIAAAIPFGLLHFQEYGNSWRHALLISLAGAAFGWMRHRTGSTKSSTLMHASYNALEFIVYFTQKGTTT